VSERIGFIGLGVMGQPMARNLVAAGFELVVHTRSAAVLDAFRADGIAVGADPADVARRSDIVITMVSDGAAVRDVVLGEDGVLGAVAPGALIIDMSTIEPAISRELAAAAAQRGIGMLDAPVSGGDVGAREATLSIMIGGEAGDLDRARPVLDGLGATITHVGPAGAGQVVKACNQIVVAITYAAVSEALVLASSAGVDRAAVLDVLSGGLAANRIMEVRRRNLLEHDFTPGFRVDLHHKDLAIALDTGDDLDVGLPVAAAVQQMLVELRALGHGDLDHSSLLLIAERRAAVAAAL
jgi:2-hydroxy-3-oxopropionate reductase